MINSNETEFQNWQIKQIIIENNEKQQKLKSRTNKETLLYL